MTDESWTIRAREGHYRAVDAASYDHSMDYAINGLMPATGATIWFGAGSTGKTQLLLWMAAHMAAVGNAVPDQWLGADICVRGNILVLTAEDLREHLLQRISAISRQMVKELGKPLSRDDVRTAFMAAQADNPILGTIGDVADSQSAKSAGTLAYELSAMKKDGLIDISAGKIKMIRGATPLAEVAA